MSKHCNKYNTEPASASFNLTYEYESFSQHLKQLGLVKDSSDLLLRKIMLNVSLRCKLHDQDFTEDEILAQSLKEYIISLDGNSLDQICEEFVLNWRIVQRAHTVS